MKRTVIALRRVGTVLERALNILQIVSAEYAIFHEQFKGELAIGDPATFLQ